MNTEMQDYFSHFSFYIINCQFFMPIPNFQLLIYKVGGRAGHAGVRYRSRAAAEKEIHFNNPSASAAPAPSSRPFLSLPHPSIRF
jgi:hypothetical protein